MKPFYALLVKEFQKKSTGKVGYYFVGTELNVQFHFSLHIKSFYLFIQYGL